MKREEQQRAARAAILSFIEKFIQEPNIPDARKRPFLTLARKALMPIGSKDPAVHFLKQVFAENQALKVKVQIALALRTRRADSVEKFKKNGSESRAIQQARRAKRRPGPR